MNAKLSKIIAETFTENNALNKVLKTETDAEVFTQVDQQIFRQGMSNLGAAVNVITTQGDAGQAGFTASAVCSVTDTPPTLLVCLNRSASVYEIFKNNKVLCVNTLASHQQHLSNLFGGKTPMAERFSQGNWKTLLTQSPVLEDALVSFDCEVVQQLSIGSHDVLFCEVKAMCQRQGNALMYFNRSYCEPHKMC
ncbi:NADH-dependent FMN reductase RutF [Acinetobacter schindleri]|jgi:flavin reductase|nr:pyrimidine utilization flavin reductase protein F [Acinetobacter schindleri]MEB5929536.1 pyrimidine utilization flavin reductase protein F [Acinetobacter schindleri]HAD69356.1 pyrimidine utilization flavin reductase protein F [Acinetobacter radioresistens]